MLRLFRYFGEYRRTAILTPVFIILETICELLLTVLIGRFIDALSGNDTTSMELIKTFSLNMLLLTVLQLVCGILCGWWAGKASCGLSKNIRNAMFDRIQDFSFSNIDKFSANSLVTRMTTDVVNVQNAVMMILRVAAKSPVSIVCALYMAFAINWKIGIVYLVVMPILLLALVLLAHFTHPIFRRVFKTYDHLNGVVRENLHGIRVVKSFVREDYESEKFKAISENIRGDFTKAEKLIAFNPFFMQFAIYICIVLISWFSASAIVGSENGTVIAGIVMTTGDLQNLFTYSMMILLSLMMLSMIYVSIMICHESVNRINEVLDEKPQIVSGENAAMDVPDGSVDFENVGFSYKDDPDKLCLSGINLHIKSGMTVGIIGGTGSGKSSLVQLIPRLYDTTIGTVKVGGRNVKEYDIEILRDSVAMVLQKNVLFAGTIKDNLRWGKADASDAEIKEVCQLSQADSFISTFPDGYDSWVEQGGANLSGGQKQRLCIARALLKHPKILIMDDSTSAVDTRTDAMIRNGLSSYMPETTKIIIAQRISSVQDADLIIVMNGGSIDGMGTHDELLLTNRIYKEAYETQQKGGGENE